MGGTIQSLQQIQQILQSASGVVNSSIGASSICGTGASQSGLNSALAGARSAINGAIGGAQNIVSVVQNIPNLISAQINSTVNQLGNVLGGLPTPTGNTLRQDIANLLRLVNDPVAFAAQYLRTQGLYPNINLQNLLQQIAQGSGFCSLISTAAGGSSVPPPSGQNANQSPPRVPGPQVPGQVNSPNSGVTSQVLSGNNPTQAQNTLGQMRFVESARLNVQRYRLELELSHLRTNANSDPNEIQRVQSELADVRSRLSSLNIGGSGS